MVLIFLSDRVYHSQVEEEGRASKLFMEVIRLEEFKAGGGDKWGETEGKGMSQRVLIAFFEEAVMSMAQVSIQLNTLS